MRAERLNIRGLWQVFIELVLSNKRISIGIVLYVIVFIVSGIWSPWQMDGLTIEDFTESADNMVMDIVPVNILYFGIYELMQLMLYVNDSYKDDMFYGVMFLMSVYASFTYMQCILRKFIIKEDRENISIPAKLVIEFIYDNILTYISCLIVYYVFPAVWKVATNLIAETDPDNGSGLLLYVVLGGVAAVGIVIPGALQLLQMGAYMFSMSLITKLLNYMDSELEWHIILKTSLIFAVAFVLIMIVNIVVNLILDRAIGRLIEEITTFIFSVPESIREIGRFLLGLLKLFAIGTGLLILFVVIFFIAGKAQGVL